MHNVTSWRLCVTIVAVKKQRVLVNLGIQHAMRMRHNVICVLPGSIIFFHFFLQNHDLKNIKLLNTECVLLFSLQMSPETFPILRRNERDMIKNAHWSSYKVPVVLVRFFMKPEFSKNIQIPNFMKIRPVGPEMFHANGWTDRRTDMTKLIVAFAILRRRLTIEGSLYYGIVLFFPILWNKVHNTRI